MKPPKRYSIKLPSESLTELSEGDYVMYKDYAKLEAENADLRYRVARLEEIMETAKELVADVSMMIERQENKESNVKSMFEQYLMQMLGEKPNENPPKN